MDVQENDLLTQVGPGTPGGELLRHYWMPVCAVKELPEDEPKKRVRILGEDLIIFRDASGRYGLIPEQCPHRHASLYFGFLEEDGIRCPYHGWKFDTEGQCIEQPFEPNDESLRERACQTSYPVQQSCGILFTYMGAGEVPLLPMWETMVRTDGRRDIKVLPTHNCNWLQAQENSLDPTHTYYLHAQLMLKHRAKKEGADVAYFGRPIEDYDFDLCEEDAWTGIRKIRIYGGDNPERELGHPAIFPNILFAPHGVETVIHWRVPADDTHTNIIWLEFTPTADGSTVDQSEDDISLTHVPHPLQADGEYKLDTFPAQDLMAWETQGPVYDRSTELTGNSDRGIYMFRNLLKAQIHLVQNGETPVGVNHDPEVAKHIKLDVSKGQAETARRMEAAE